MCLDVCAKESETPVNDINFLATSKTALIFKYVLAGTVHFDVGLVMHTMQQWRKIIETDTWTDTHIRTYYSTLLHLNRLHLFTLCRFLKNLLPC